MTAAFDRIPLIDIGPLFGNDAEAKTKTASELADAAGNVGFLYITNHGIAPALIERLEAAAADFFALPLETKQKYFIGKSTCHRGYVPTGEEGYYNDEPGKVDLKEAFDLALDLPATDPDYLAGNRMLGPNVWPAELPSFKADVKAYYDAALALGNVMFRGFALALGLPETYFEPLVTKPTSQLRLVHYPQNDTGDTSGFGIGPHTDFECFTILHATKPGLQVQNPAGDWIEAPPIPGAFVVNIGDMLEAWSNGRFVATGHRVLKTPIERFSFPLFCALDYHTVVKPMLEFVSAENPPRFPEITAGDHLVAQSINAFRYLRTLLASGEISMPDTAPSDQIFGHDSLKSEKNAATLEV